MKFLKRAFHRLGLSSFSHSKDNPDYINNLYLTTAPSPQNALDVFKNEWSSMLPPPFDHLQAGKVPLFEDDRIKWLISEIGDLQGCNILELGPLEGGHSYMLERAGAESVTAIDANTHAYLKCLISKELFGLHRVNFLCGDFVEYMKSDDCPQFDLGLASGVLYHMLNPVEVISLLAKCCRRHVLIWTHYYDEDWAKAKGLQAKFPFKQQADYAGFSHTLVRQYYGDQVLVQPHFCGGSRPFSNWMYREEIIKCLKYFDFKTVKINFEEVNHPHGPAFTLLASRT